MGKYKVSFEIDAPSFAEAMTLAEDRVLQPKDDRTCLSVEAVRTSPGRVEHNRSRMTWSVNVPTDPSTSPPGNVWLALDFDRERMAIVVSDDQACTTRSVYVRPEDASLAIRAMRAWPLGLLDEIVATRARKGGEGGGRA